MNQPPGIEWPEFLGRSDLLWEGVPQSWDDGAFIGNGDLGAILYEKEGQLIWDINRTSLYVNQSRFPVGHLTLKTEEKIQHGTTRLSLWNAEAYGLITTAQGSISWRSFTASNPDVIVIEIESNLQGAGPNILWSPAEARPPRKIFRKEPLLDQDLHPPPMFQKRSNGFISIQNYLDQTSAVIEMTCQEIKTNRFIYYVSLGYGNTEAKAREEAGEAINQALQLGINHLTSSHRNWWHHYYPASFLSIPDARLESYYWIQMYKLGSAMRPEGPILDLMGPWFRETPWPAIWWNLNVQLAYSPLATANRLVLSESLWKTLDAHHQALHENVRAGLRDRAMALGRCSGPDFIAPVDLIDGKHASQLEAGNLPWLCFLYWQYARYTADDNLLENRVLPILKPAIEFYLLHLKEGPDGKLHLPITHSPELANLPDANYDLMLLVWGLQTLIASAGRLKLNEQDLPRWKTTLEKLPPFAIDETGLMIGPGRPLRESHRHYSHLIGVYPLHIISSQDPDSRALIEKSVHHWVDLIREGGHLAGYTHTGAASIHALLGQGDRALVRLHRMLDEFSLPNTLYRETGPVIETPLALATSLQEMLFQSNRNCLRLFPAIPSHWKECSFSHLRGEGAFLVSGTRKEGHTTWIKVESLAGEPCVVVVKDWKSAFILASNLGDSPLLYCDQTGYFSLNLPKGGWAELGETPGSLRETALPVERPVIGNNPYPDRYR